MTGHTVPRPALARLLAATRCLPTRFVPSLLATALWSFTAAAADGPVALDAGNTAWVLTSTALVLFMTIPGLALFYGGLVRQKNVLSVLMQCLALTALLSLVWLVLGYSLAFDATGMAAGQDGRAAFIGGLGRVLLAGVAPDTLFGSIPEVLFFTFQCTFAVITPALILGAFAERMRFSAVLLFSALWLVVVYAPICHLTRSGAGGISPTSACSISPAASSSTSPPASPPWSPAS